MNMLVYLSEVLMIIVCIQAVKRKGEVMCLQPELVPWGNQR